MNDNLDSHEQVQIPGSAELVESGVLPSGIILLVGDTGTGKTMYCRQFLLDGLRGGHLCILISPTLSQKQLKELFLADAEALPGDFKFIDPYKRPSDAKKGSGKLSTSLKQLRAAVAGRDRNRGSKGRATRVVVDSLTQLMILFDEKDVMKFVSELSVLLRDVGASAILTLATSDQRLISTFGSMADGIIEMKIEDSKGDLSRSIRLHSIKGMNHNPSWINFRIGGKGTLIFGSDSGGGLLCTLCQKAVTGSPIMQGDLVFDTRQCLETYGKLAGVYGSKISDTGLPSESFNVNFFFIDIVGLSDPSSSVKKQVQKIDALNKLIASCDAYSKNLRDKKIILPTGDGMAIGFLMNPERPLQLAIELHRKLRAYNRSRSSEDTIGVRIGLGAGPVFTVTDVNDVQNVWGPGIILARRVMDAGDTGHILVAGRLAEELVNLKDEYKSVLRPICNSYELKHGQRIRLYSAYSHDFGRSEQPDKVPRL
ncbi:MAG: hypothetical protein MN733_41890 [Nitrososphaera sp.]|nr:hypothetical protein [Nitrososphaera sp.]